MTAWRLRREGLHWRELGGEVVAPEATASVYLAANRTGALLVAAREEADQMRASRTMGQSGSASTSRSHKVGDTGDRSPCAPRADPEA